ncbi:MAG: AraC family transcriptional regulator [Gammaproteobacteria bacterium]|jgi:AraC-like DNA-binding protein
MTEDILSDVLRTVRLSGAVFFDVEATAPWVAEAPPATSLASLVKLNSDHIIEYHVITSGYGWATLIESDCEPVRLAPGSIIMFPQGDSHVLSSRPKMRAEPNYAIFDQPENLSPPFYIKNIGGGTEKTSMTCGFLGCDLLPYNPIIQALPRMVHVPDGYTAGDGWLSSLIKGIMKESRNKRVGSENVLSRLSELIFIEVVRSYMETLSSDASGWLAALADRHTGCAIRLLHNNPERNWTLDLLANEVGVSRTVLIKRFTDHLGVAPITYLCNWRMQIAAGKLRGGGAPIAKIAAEVGYESEAAFSRTFKRCTGVSPGAWRSSSK